MKRIQSQAGLEAEVVRLKCLLVNIRGRIEAEIGNFPYQKPLPANQNIGNGNLTGGYVINHVICSVGIKFIAFIPR
ncbi:hypothetical protein HanRHA438_Chr17g0816871 [Helianthus annuus]|nr:hypothetical protein HanHA89_Chr17g0709911 [Helianthus annuus]KAJ0632738.1 hypothetical protein HanLR1_Chr17g0668481 [Helianthus annuus]KAJ0826668.1 hypothetical protein HanRHA438_Chr17g0816871 [Helianthus annuus]